MTGRSCTQGRNSAGRGSCTSVPEIDGMHLRRVDQNAAVPSATIAPGSHEPHTALHDIHVLVGHVIAQIVLGHGGHTEFIAA